MVKVSPSLTAGVLCLLALAACGGGQANRPPPTTAPPATSAAPSPTTAATPTPAAVGTVAAYFIRDGKLAAAHRPLFALASPFEAAVRGVIAGPDELERSVGLTTAVPGGTRLLGIAVADPVVTVNLSREFAAGGGSFGMTARLAQVVFAVTQFPEQRLVRFELDGTPVTVFGSEGIVLDHPVGRADFEALSPAILVEGPTVGETVGNPLLVHGTANTFEATFQLTLVDGGGRLLAARTVRASSGTGTRGSFAEQVPYSGAGSAEVVVFELSARDGSRINEVRIPVTLKP